MLSPVPRLHKVSLRPPKSLVMDGTSISDKDTKAEVVTGLLKFLELLNTGTANPGLGKSKVFTSLAWNCGIIYK